MPRHASTVPGITQATSNNWLRPDALRAMVRTLENPTTATTLEEIEAYFNSTC
jgi:hypothetical protein